ncbi:procollagen-proline 4-dioxygenase [Aureococcus anophagefferens]|nr:procollagen-proline 4-dioxygenase [Aureococcus anophagefferens]
MARAFAVLALAARCGLALEYCSSVHPDADCETLRAHDTGAPHFLDTGSLGGSTTLEDLMGTGIQELKYMTSTKKSKKARGVSMGAKFRNFRRDALEMRWDDGSPEGVYSGMIPALGRSSTLSYDGHSFIFTHPKTKQRIARFTMKAGANLYIIPPADDDAETVASEDYKKSLEEVAFMERYDAENGIPWLAYYPRAKPVLSHAPAGPRVFLVREMLSEFECDHIIELGTKVVRKSMVGQGGGFTSKTRTSENGWLRRSASPILENIYKRFGDVLGIDHDLLRSGKNAEELQVVRYDRSQEYAPHHDFGDDGTPQQRFLTLLLYIQLPEEGGATSFPKANDGMGVQVVPARGDAVLFYSMLPDGNADDLALHAGMPVRKGQKWVCNLWVWDPHRHGH